MEEYINPDYAGAEEIGKQEYGWRGDGRPLGVKNRYCSIDGHYCEQGECNNCNYEKVY